VRLEEIAGEHEFVRKQRKEMGICFSELPVRLFCEDGLRMLAAHSLVRLMRKEGSLWCIGSLRIFRLLKLGLPGKEVIPALIYERMKKKYLLDALNYEWLIEPAIFSLNSNNKRHMGWQWQQENNLPFFRRTVMSPGIKTLAQLLGVDPRTLKGDNTDENLRAENEQRPPETA
jgi:hypothetical protein